MRIIEKLLAEPFRRGVCFAEQDAGDVAPAGGTSVEDQLADIMAEDDTSKPDDTDDDSAELEIGSEKVKVPKVVKGAWDGLQQKIQANAESTKTEKAALAADREKASTFFKLAQTVIEEHADLKAIDKQLAPYLKLSTAEWMEWSAKDPEGAKSASNAVSILQIERAKLNDAIQTKVKSVQESETKAHAEARTKADADIAAAIPDWSPTKRAALEKAAMTYPGVTKEMVDALSHIPAMWKILADVQVLHAVREKAKAKSAQTVVAEADPITPAPKLRSAAGGGTLSKGLGDNVPPDQWVKNFNAMRKRGQA